MNTDWRNRDVSNLFDAYDDYVEEQLGYLPLIADLQRSIGASSKVLDYGCGGGKVSRRLAMAGIQTVHGVDIAPAMVEKARASGVNDKCHYSLIDTGALPFTHRTFDAAVCCFVFINIPSEVELRKVAGEIYRVLKPGGLFYVLDSNPSAVGVRFSTFQSGDTGTKYRNGDARRVYLDIPNHADRFEIVDTHWERSTYLSILNGAGFGKIETAEIVASDLNPQPGGKLGDAERSHAPFVRFKAFRTAP